nr:hypothetical protein [Tanacetum cinerariifolium]
IKGPGLADFLADIMTKDSPTQVKTDWSDDTIAEIESMEEREDTKTKAPRNLRAETDIRKIYTNGASNEYRSGAGAINVSSFAINYFISWNAFSASVVQWKSLLFVHFLSVSRHDRALSAALERNLFKAASFLLSHCICFRLLDGTGGGSMMLPDYLILSICPQLPSLPWLIVPSDSNACIRGLVLPSMAGPYVFSILRIKRYIDTKPNHELIHYCLENPRYEFKWILNPTPKTPATPGSDGDTLTRPKRVKESYATILEYIKNKLTAEAEVVQIIFTGIDNNIYFTADTCPNAMEMWKTIERLKQGKSYSVQDLKISLFLEFRKFTSRDGETLDSYYSRFYKMMNELVRNQCIVTNHQVNVQFLLQLKLEWKRSQAATKNRGKEIAISPSPTYDSEPEQVVGDEASLTEKEIDKLIALISMSFKKIYKPINNNLRTLSNTLTEELGMKTDW